MNMGGGNIRVLSSMSKNRYKFYEMDIIVHISNIFCFRFICEKTCKATDRVARIGAMNPK